jgi:uncharacterized membrane protein YgcG
MAMRDGRFAKRAGREFVKNLIWFLVAFVPLAIILIVLAGVPLREVLVFGGVFVPVMAAVLTVTIVWAGGAGDYHPRGSRPGIYTGGGEGGHGGWYDCGSHGGGDFGGGGGGDGCG